MKKFFYFIILMVAVFISCGPSETEVQFTNEDNLEKVIFDECVSCLQNQLKDPTSLKFDSGVIGAYEVSLENAVKCTIDYDIDRMLNRNETESFKKFNEHNTNIANIWNANINNCKYYVVPIKFYGKNSYGVYSSEYINIIVVVFPISVDKHGIIEYEGTTWEGDYINDYCNVIDVKLNSMIIDVPDNMKI